VTQSPEVDLDLASADKPAARIAFMSDLAKIAAHSGRTRLGLLLDFLRLRFGPGRLAFSEYVGLRLFDRTDYEGVEKAGFVGFRASLKIWFQANYQVNAFGLVNNKVAADLLFAAHGFPTLSTFALFRDGIGLGGRFLLRTESELRTFLHSHENYPLFGKPISGHQSLGTSSIVRYDSSVDALITSAGQVIPLDAYISFVKGYGASGYLFQRRMVPHATVREICGNRLATVRVLTIVAGGQPKIVRACWKIPAGPNAADNFWRPGNLLAQLDLESGQVLRVLRGEGTGLEELTYHPDTGAPIKGMAVPHWSEVIRVAVEGSRVVDEMGLIGWDIAPVDSGAVLVELNETPDFKLHQLADRRGLLDREFKEFLLERRKHRAAQVRNAKKLRQGL